MESSNHQPLLSRLRLMVVISGNNEPEPALCANSPSSQNIVNCGVNTTGRHANSLAGATDHNTWAKTFHDMAHDNMDAKWSQQWIQSTPRRTDTPVMKINREKRRPQSQKEVISAAEPAQREELGSMCKRLVERTLCIVLNTRYYAAISWIKNSSVLFVESVVTKTIHRRAVDETLNQSFNRRPRNDTFMQALIIKVVDDLGFISSFAAFGEQRVSNAVKEELIWKPLVTKEFLLQFDRFPPDSAGTLSGTKEFKASCLHCRSHDRKNQRYCNSLMDPRDKRKKHRYLSSLLS